MDVSVHMLEYRELIHPSNPRMLFENFTNKYGFLLLEETLSFIRISNSLTEKLLQDGWVDKVKNLTMEEINKNDKAAYPEILSKIEPTAMSMLIFF